MLKKLTAQNYNFKDLLVNLFMILVNLLNKLF